MLFNTYAFLAFLVIVLAGFFLALRFGSVHGRVFLLVASLFFYSFWKFEHLFILLASLAFNFLCGTSIAAARDRPRAQSLLLAAGVAGNLLLLAYYKYTMLLLGTANSIWNLGLSVPEIILPIGISFFTFQQIAFLVDTRTNPDLYRNPIDFCLFVTFFPHLIAGPLVHHREMMPQFARLAAGAFRWSNLSIGLSIFVLGLAKKVLLADSVAPYADGLFNSGFAGGGPDLVAAWAGTLAYALQIYFDFSAYSDMAVGLARMFNIRLPANFYSPYKSRSIIEFWRRWHITLSRFLRQYLYIPLGGSRRGPVRRYLNLMIVMLLGGLWHGANWTFALWGGLHGLYLMINHGWRAVRGDRPLLPRLPSWLGTGTQTLITFIAVLIAWVPFRANSLEQALEILSGMAGLNGIASLDRLPRWLDGDLPWAPHLAALLAIAWFAPNTIEIFRRWRPVVNMEDIADFRRAVRARWRPTVAWSLATAALFVLCLLQYTKVSPFLYFQF